MKKKVILLSVFIVIMAISYLLKTKEYTVLYWKYMIEQKYINCQPILSHGEAKLCEEMEKRGYPYIAH